MPWNDERPMSPHLQVYDLPLTANLSILHRGTGAVLLFGLILLVVVLLTLISGEESWAVLHNLLQSWFGLIVLWGFIFSLYYHMCNGIRHLFWDSGHYMEKSSLKKTGFMVIFGSILLTVFTCSIPFLI